MARKKKASLQEFSDQRASAPVKDRLGNRGRAFLSGLIVLQLLAVTAEPFRFFTQSTRGTSPAADPARELLAPYVEFMYLSHGYFFFAPEPGPSHLMDCSLTLEEGKRARLRFPDRHAQWPRLLYHRHFMLSENLHQLWMPPIQEEWLVEEDPLILEWQSQRERFELVRDSMKRHLANRFQAREVTIDRVEHRLPSSDEVLVQRIRLSDKRLYMTLPDAPTDGAPPPPGGILPGGERGGAKALGTQTLDTQPGSPIEPIAGARADGAPGAAREVKP